MNWEEMRQIQPTVMTMLEKSVEKNRLAHAYIFEGRRGAGKKQAALLLTQRLMCTAQDHEKPCGECRECKRIKHGNHPDVMTLEPDGTTIRKAQVESLQKEFTYRGMEPGLKVYIVNDADKMTASAANSLLKFLEEPESPTLALLLTENVHFMLDTIRSRAQKITFAPPSLERRAAIFLEQDINPNIAALLARLPDEWGGGNVLENVEWIVHARGLVIQLTEEVYHRPQQMLLTLQEKWLPHFKDREELDIGLDLLLFWHRDVLALKHRENDLAFPDQKEKLEQEALHMSETVLAQRLQWILQAKRRLRANVNAQLLMEHLLLRLQEGS